MKATAQQLGNTPAVCRKSYIHPAVIATYLDGKLDAIKPSRSAALASLSDGERTILGLLEQAAYATHPTVHAA